MPFFGRLSLMKSVNKKKAVLYFSPVLSKDEFIAPLNQETFIQRLNDLSRAVSSLRTLEQYMKKGV